MLQVYPEKVAALPSQQLQTLLQTLEFGIASSEPEAVQSALEALAALAKFDFQSKQAGKPGLQAGAGISVTACGWCSLFYHLCFLSSLNPATLSSKSQLKLQKLCTMSCRTHSLNRSLLHSLTHDQTNVAKQLGTPGTSSMQQSDALLLCSRGGPAESLSRSAHAASAA